MHRRPELWGPTAVDFDPDRFLDSWVHKYLTLNPFNFLPFGRIELVEEAMPLALGGRVLKEWKEEEGIQARERVQMRSHLTIIHIEGGVVVEDGRSGRRSWRRKFEELMYNDMQRAPSNELNVDWESSPISQKIGVDKLDKKEKINRDEKEEEKIHMLNVCPNVQSLCWSYSAIKHPWINIVNGKKERIGPPGYANLITFNILNMLKNLPALGPAVKDSWPSPCLISRCSKRSEVRVSPV
ncbi:hypothetical protein K435DRAFT_794368 [Dendrothele bispora CBS 962.96]|uniref:Uncharacterized protein n=1 Tax=Dendrothele bispora (strain CBS 962.96) TaxID=1314807 RepID=A0A4S8MCA8_DENBC|nr:hypothetical protein K435DRAFT_794368 [Dendrothele bispora CBS 962.96]